DPRLTFSNQNHKNGWLLRRLAPHCCRVELAELAHRRAEAKLLYTMGRETANLHLGSHKKIPMLKKDLKRRPANWLRGAAASMMQATTADWKSFQIPKK